jgi:hypothetical protein
MTEIMWRTDKLRETIEKVLINRIKFIGDDEQTYQGYPSKLIEEIAFAIDEYLKSNKL